MAANDDAIITDGEQGRFLGVVAVDASLARRSLAWRPRLGATVAVGWTADWYRAFDAGASAAELTFQQIKRFQELP